MRPRRRLRRFARDLSKRLAVGTALSGYLLAVTGWPVPARSAKDLSRPFPCQNHACGCQSAEECWKSCCCYTRAEKLAWARENHVEPPAWFVRKASSALATSLAQREHKHASTGPRACCAAHQRCAKCAHREAGPTPGVRLVLGPLARQCHGQSDSWCELGAVAPPPPIVGWQFEWNVVQWLTEQSPTVPSFEFSPPTPPPRV